MSRNMYLFIRTFLFVLSTLVLFGKGAASDCYRTTTYQYKGHQNTTHDGQPCIRWDSLDHTYQAITGSDDENYCRDPGRNNYLWCYTSTSRNYRRCGISKCVTVDVTQCGSLKIEQPRILGRSVTFTFIPDTNADADMKWQRTNKVNPWSSLPDNNKFTQYTQDGIYYLIITNAVSGNDEVFYRVDYQNNNVSCLMETPKLELQDISSNPCGFVYLRTTKVTEDENIKIEYYPSENVLENPGNFKRKWIRRSNQTHSQIRLTNDLYEENEMQNDNYVLTIFMFNARMNGQYGVFCGLTAKFSNFVTVILPVPPSAPEFERLQNIETCKGCIVGEDRDQFSVLCKTNGGTEPVRVTMSIGNESLSPQRYDKTPGYMAFFNLRNKHHMAVMKCTVMNDALASPLTVTAHVYVIKSPIFKSFVAPEVLKEGDIVNITCIFDSGRPVPNVSLNISGTEVSSAIQMDYFNPVSFSYTSVVTLTSFERIWNKENIACCRYNEWYRNISECSQPKQIYYMFPPSNIKVEVKDEEGLPLQMYAVCTIYDSNPACWANISALSGIIASERYTKNVSQLHGGVDTEHAVNLNVSKDDNGNEIKCAAECPDFTVDLSDTCSIVLHNPPIIEFSIPGSVLDILEGEQARVKCSAQSIPASNISWVEQTDDGNITKKQCHMEADCSIDINAHFTSQRHLICQIHYLQTTDQKHLTINILDKDQHRSNDKEKSASGDKSFIWIILGSSVAVLLVVFTVCLITRKKLRNTKAKQEANEARFSTGTDGDRNKEAEREGPLHRNLKDAANVCDNFEVTYSQPDKNKAAPSDDATYSEVFKTGNSNPPDIRSQQTMQVEGGQMLYADLDFDSTSAPSKTAIAKRRNTPTEYVAIDFVKTAAEKAKESESSEAENIYANQ